MFATGNSHKYIIHGHSMEHEITSAHIKDAFMFFSKDGVTISKDDIRKRVDRYFPNLSLDQFKTLISTPMSAPAIKGRPVMIGANHRDTMTEQVLLDMFATPNKHLAALSKSKQPYVDAFSVGIFRTSLILIFVYRYFVKIPRPSISPIQC